MMKIKYLILFCLFYSCSSITFIEKNEIVENDNVSKITLENNNEKVKKYENELKVSNIRIFLSNLEKKELELDIKDTISINSKNYTNEKIKITALENKIIFNNLEYDQLVIENKNILGLSKYKYYGNFIITASNSKLKVINILDVETYLLSVLSFEIPNSFPMEALKAQAIISRTYAYKNISRNKKEFDVYSDTRSQVYEGIANKNIDNITKAVKETKDIIITHNNKVIDALFHSYSGGYTASAKEVYGNDLEYLQSVEDKFSNYVPENILTWRYIITKENLEKEVGFEIEEIELDYSNSNRVTNIIFFNKEKNLKKEYSGVEFRRKFSINGIKSTSYTIHKEEKEYVVIGSGFGHGVGFSQWSSKAMALDYNMNYEEIIKYFYKNVEIKNKGE